MTVFRALFIFSFLFSPLFAEDFFNAMPNCIVYGCVNVITGKYVESHDDLATCGAHPIILTRSFSNRKEEMDNLYDFWDLNLSSTLEYQEEEKEFQINVCDRGSSSFFKGRGSDFTISWNIFNSGITIMPSPYRNSYISNKALSKSRTEFLLKNPSLETLHFKINKDDQKSLLTHLITPVGCEHRYSYDDEKVSQIRSFDGEGCWNGRLCIQRAKKNYVKVTCNAGREVTYRFKKQQSLREGSTKHRYCLSSVEKNFGPTTKYAYQKRGKYKRERLIKKSLPDDRFLKINYHKAGRVKSLFTPAGVDPRPIKVGHFKYKKRQATVFDAYKQKKIYSWTKDKRLKSIQEFENDKPYRKESFVWQYAFLKERTLSDADGNIVVAKAYKYDLKGNLLQESVSGNISGFATSPETYSKTYQYDKNNLVIFEDHTFQKLHYSYHEGTSLLKSKFIADDSGIKQRYYYEYDPCGAVKLEIIDDGYDSDINNLSGVTERRIQRIQNSKEGHPENIAHYFLDLNSGEEVLLRRIVSTFSKGLLIREAVFDANDVFVFAKEWVYNDSDLVIEETDPLGHKTFYNYDMNGNCISKQTPTATHRMYYDYLNRPIKEEIEAEGQTLCKRQVYDLKGNKTVETDIYGNETRYTYDSLGRVIKKTLPRILGKNGLVTSKELFCYNELNHPVLKVDPSGYMTKKSFNIHGKPILIEHPDESTEKIIYNLDGTVKETINSIGTKTCFQYDFLKRKISEEKFSSKGELLSTIRWIFNAFHLLQMIDPEGYITEYSYDGAGRLISEKKGISETRYAYDSLGRQSQKWEMSDDPRVSIAVYDVMDRIVEERLENAKGKIYKHKQFGYDSAGNRIRETIFTNEDPKTTFTYYNAYNLPIKIIAPDETVTQYIYHFDYQDPYRNSVPCVQSIDPLGNSTLTIKNARDQIAFEERKNLFGDSVQKVRFIYDILGNITERIEEVFIGEDKLRTVVTAFEYDSMGREATIIEALGEPEQKITRRKFNALGDVAEIFKPDGVILYHAYDALGRLSRLRASDDSIDYVYLMDQNHHIIEAHDGVNETVTKRTYDELGLLRSEILDHGAKINYEYDLMGRLQKFTLPDLSEIEYGYNAAYLKEVKRNQFCHRYHYNLSGKLASVNLMQDLGVVAYEYDSCLRPTSICSPYVEMKAQYDASGNLITFTQADSPSSHYTYDALNQLVSEKGGANHAYQIDSLGNRTKKDATEYTVNPLNQLVKQGEHAYSYDLNGNLKTKGELQFQYDALDRLTEVTTPSEKIFYHYDAFHRRTKKTTWKEGKKREERYLYQGDKEMAATDETGKIFQLRVMGIGHKGDIGAAVLLEIDGASYVPLHDYRGNVIRLLNHLGQTVERSLYTAYGEEQCDNPVNPWRFSSKRVDPETGFSCFGRRYYDAAIGRWTTPDPVGFVDGPNLYCYVGNQPTLFIDPQGLLLDSLFEILSNTVCSPFEIFTDGDISYYYENDDKYIGTILPGASLDKQSHFISHKNDVPYGPFMFCLLNGIFNNTDSVKSNIGYAEDMGVDCKIVAVYNASHGLWDLAEAFINLLGINTRPVTLVQKKWDEYFDYCDKNNMRGAIIQDCHSQGAILIGNALEDYNPERAKNIHLIAVCPARYINKKLCGSVLHIVGKTDIVPWIDVVGRMENQDTIQIVERDKSVAWYDIFDHSFQSKSYREAQIERIRYIQQNFLGNNP